MMTFIFNPGLGELLDRLSIVSRKIVEIDVTGVGDATFLAEEASAIGLECERIQGVKDAAIQLRFALRLAAINAALWERETLLRQDPTTEQTADLARAIAWLNDERRNLIHKLSGRTTDPKLYRR